MINFFLLNHPSRMVSQLLLCPPPAAHGRAYGLTGSSEQSSVCSVRTHGRFLSRMVHRLIFSSQYGTTSSDVRTVGRSCLLASDRTALRSVDSVTHLCSQILSPVPTFILHVLICINFIGDRTAGRSLIDEGDRLFTCPPPSHSFIRSDGRSLDWTRVR